MLSDIFSVIKKKMFIEPKLCSKYSTKLEDEGGKLPKIMLSNRIDPIRGNAQDERR